MVEPVARLGWLTAQASYLLAPLLVAAAVSGVVLRFDLVPALRRPLDGGATWRGRPIFGANKTWRGLACCVTGGVLAVAIQKYAIGDRAGELAVIDYTQANPVLLGGGIGVAATVGELPNSFLKRRLGVAPGGRARGGFGPVFYLFDQVDLLLVVWPVLLWWCRPGWPLVATSVALVVAAHQAVSLIGFAIGARSSPFY